MRGSGTNAVAGQLRDVERSADVLTGFVATDPNVVLPAGRVAKVNLRVEPTCVVITAPVAGCVVDDERGVALSLEVEAQEVLAVGVVDDDVRLTGQETPAAVAEAHVGRVEATAADDVGDLLRIGNKPAAKGVGSEVRAASADGKRSLRDGLPVRSEHECRTENP